MKRFVFTVVLLSIMMISSYCLAADNFKYTGEMITIPAGEFIMGNDNGGKEEKPAHKVSLPKYQIGKYEVTRGDFKKFMDAGGYSKKEYWSDEGWKWKESDENVYSGMYGNVSVVKRPANSGKRLNPEYWAEEQEWIGHDYNHPKFMQTDKHPVIGVSYYEAQAFCKWAGGRIPTEAEYEKAARWDEKKKHSNIWPWGDVWDPEKSNNPDDHNLAGGGYRVNQSAPVGSYPAGASSYGCMDMVGNAYEWCGDFAKSYPGNPEPYDYTGKCHVVKGGCWDDVGTTTTFRIWYLDPRSSGVMPGDSDYIGFRIARSVK